MKVFVYERYGGPEVLQMSEKEKPTPGENEVLVKVYATTVTIGDTIMRSFNLPTPRWQWPIARLYLGLRKPKRTILGMELAGIIEATGKKVTRFKNGDPVFASTFSLDFGGHAEYKCFPHDGMLAIKPDTVSFEEAAAAVGGGMTAVSCLRKGKLKAGSNVLIYGASGAVGTCAVQLAKNYFNTHVTGVCSTSNLQMVKSLGANRVIDYTKENFSETGETYDLIFDAVGKSSSSIWKKSLKKKGIYLNVLTDSGSREKIEDLIFLKELMEQGKLKPVIDRCYTFEQIVEAHKYVEKGHKKGNVAITVIKT